MLTSKTTSLARVGVAGCVLTIAGAAAADAPCCIFDGCLDIDRQACIDLGGIPGEEGQDCVCIDCGGPVGACCVVNVGCVPDTTAFECQASGGTFHADVDCDDFPCWLDHGACCLDDDACVETDPFACADKLGGIFLGKFSICAESQCGPPCEADLDGDGQVASTDLLALLGQWGSDACGPPDFAGDGVGIDDLILMLGLWGPCP